MAGYMSLNSPSLSIIDGNRDEYPVTAEVKVDVSAAEVKVDVSAKVKVDVSAASLSLASPDKAEHPFSDEGTNACDFDMEAQSKEGGDN